MYRNIKVSELIQLLQSKCKTGDEVVEFLSYEWDDDLEGLSYHERTFEKVSRRGNVVRAFVSR